MISRRGFLAGIAALSGCSLRVEFPGSSDREIRYSPSSLESALHVPENINKIARFLLENDLKKTGESLFAIYGPVDNIRIQNVPYEHPLIPALQSVRDGNPTTEKLADRVVSTLKGQWTGHDGFYRQIREFLVSPSHPARGYFLDVVESTVDGSAFPGVRIPTDCLMTAHGHPTLSEYAFLSDADKRNVHFRNAFGYSNGMLSYIYFRDGKDGATAIRVPDKELVNQLDLVVAKLHATRDIIFIDPANPSRAHHTNGMKDAVKHFERVFHLHLFPRRQGELIQVAEHIYDKLFNRFKYLEHNGNNPDAVIKYRNNLLKLDELVSLAGLKIPLDQKRDPYLTNIRGTDPVKEIAKKSRRTREKSSGITCCRGSKDSKAQPRIG